MGEVHTVPYGNLYIQDTDGNGVFQIHNGDKVFNQNEFELTTTQALKIDSRLSKDLPFTDLKGVPLTKQSAVALAFSDPSGIYLKGNRAVSAQTTLRGSMVGAGLLGVAVLGAAWFLSRDESMGTVSQDVKAMTVPFDLPSEFDGGRFVIHPDQPGKVGEPEVPAEEDVDGEDLDSDQGALGFFATSQSQDDDDFEVDEGQAEPSHEDSVEKVTELVAENRPQEAIDMIDRLVKENQVPKDQMAILALTRLTLSLSLNSAKHTQADEGLANQRGGDGKSLEDFQGEANKQGGDEELLPHLLDDVDRKLADEQYEAGLEGRLTKAGKLALQRAERLGATDYRQAISLCREAARFFEEQDNDYLKERALSLAGHYGDHTAYVELGLLEQAAKSAEEYAKLIEGESGFRDAEFYYIEAARIYHKAGSYDKALEIIHKILKNSNQYWHFIDLVKIGADCYQQKGDDTLANQYTYLSSLMSKMVQKKLDPRVIWNSWEDFLAIKSHSDMNKLQSQFSYSDAKSKLMLDLTGGPG